MESKKPRHGASQVISVIDRMACMHFLSFAIVICVATDYIIRQSCHRHHHVHHPLISGVQLLVAIVNNHINLQIVIILIIITVDHQCHHGDHHYSSAITRLIMVAIIYLHLVRRPLLHFHGHYQHYQAHHVTLHHVILAQLQHQCHRRI
jgi:hypothetical protein